MSPGSGAEGGVGRDEDTEAIGDRNDSHDRLPCERSGMCRRTQRGAARGAQNSAIREGRHWPWGAGGTNPPGRHHPTLDDVARSTLMRILQKLQSRSVPNRTQRHSGPFRPEIRLFIGWRSCRRAARHWLSARAFSICCLFDVHCTITRRLRATPHRPWSRRHTYWPHSGGIAGLARPLLMSC